MTNSLNQITSITMTKIKFDFPKRIVLTLVFSLMIALTYAQEVQVSIFNGDGGDALWSNQNNWDDGFMPSEEDTYSFVCINADVIVDVDVEIQHLTFFKPSIISVQKGKIFAVSDTIEWNDESKLILEDGAQWIYDESIPITVMKNIVAYDVDTHLWNFIASPIIEDVVPTIENGFLTDPETGYALYAFNEENHSWTNFKEVPFTLTNGSGYLYANALDTTLLFSGHARGCATPIEINLSYHANNGNMAGCNFVGNPLPCNAYISKSYYVVNKGSNSLITVARSSDIPITPCTGIIVKAEEVGDVVIFSHEPLPSTENHGYLEITAAKSNAQHLIMDQALLSFNPGDDLGKFGLFEGAPLVYFTKDNKDLAILSIDSVEVQPLKFKAEENGSYTLHFEPKALNLNYLHLIDNMTGSNVDLLANPNYTFNATTNDYAERFKLVFDPHYGVEEHQNETFAYYENGEIVINDIETQDFASLQIVDMTGRVIVSHSGRIQCFPTNGMAPGVYVLRLKTQDGMRTQKLVIQ